jgi:FixJ family two-component response regulator
MRWKESPLNLIAKQPLVLVVDDVQRNADGIARLLRDDGYAASTATSGAQALEAIQVVPPNCLIVDAIMPGMTGADLVRAVRERHPMMPIVLTTTFAAEMELVKALKAGANFLLEVPVHKTELLAIVESLLAWSERYNNVVAERDQFERAFNTLNANMRQIAVRNPLA